jgi:predicted DNA-binding transcriptional regulator AlpA
MPEPPSLASLAAADHSAATLERAPLGADAPLLVDVPFVYPPIPTTFVERRWLSTRGGGDVRWLPAASGVYFAFADGRCAYIGQSTNLRNRVGGSHEHLKDGDLIGYVEIPLKYLNFSECHYIAICRPSRNFGGERSSEKARWRFEDLRKAKDLQKVEAAPAVVAQADEKPLVLAISNVAKLSGLPESRIRKLCDYGRMPKPMRVGSLIRWKAAEICDWIDRGMPKMRDWEVVSE